MIPAEYQSFSRTVTVGCVNFNPVWGDKKATLAKMEANIAEAAAQGMDLVTFPEEALTGASSCQACRAERQACDEHRSMAETVPGPASEQVAALAKQLDIYVVFGLPERDRQRAEILYNAVAVVGPEGILGTYRKIHLGAEPWLTEGIVFTPGDRLPVFPTRFGPIGVQICYDFWFNPELTRILTLKGARLIVNCCGTYAGPEKRDYLVHTTAVRAQENLVYAASANLVGGPDREDYSADRLDDFMPAYYAGHSVIAGPAFPRFNHIYAEAGAKEELISATLSFDKLHRWQSVFPMRDWRAGRQAHASRLIANEFTLLADQAVGPAPSERSNGA